MTAVDLSDYSAAAVRYGTWLSMKLDAELLLINVINHRDIEMVQRAMIGYDAFSLPNYLEAQVQDRVTKMNFLEKAHLSSSAFGLHRKKKKEQRHADQILDEQASHYD